MRPSGDTLKGLDINPPKAIIGLVIGLALGLVYTWVIAPVELVNTRPVLLRTDYRLDWVRLVALSYVVDGDIERARARLDGLKHEDVSSATQVLIEECAAAGRPADILRSLTMLAQALDVYTPAMLVYLHTPTSSSPPAYTSAPSPTLTPTPPLTHTPTPHASSPLVTPTRKPTRTPRPPTPTPPLLPPFQLAQQEQICKPGQTPRIEVVVRDEHSMGLAGVEVWLMWPGGADRAITGLKPKSGAGYADFNAERGVTEPINYTLGISELGMPLVTDLQIAPCPAQKGKEPLLGSWRIVLERRPPETE
jgi:hypothetical protein